MIDTVFFDFNGTIIDDVDLCLNILNEMLESCGKNKINKERYLEIFRFPIVDYYRLAGFDFNDISFEALSKIFIEKYQQASLNCPLYPNVIETFTHLRGKGIKLVLLSASQIDNLIEQTNHFGISKYFDKILGIDNIYAKSKVSVGLDYINSSSINKETTLMIGDTLHDVEVANEMGIKPVLFSCGHQSKSVLSKAKVDIVSSYIEFERYVNKQNENNN